MAADNDGWDPVSRSSRRERIHAAIALSVFVLLFLAVAFTPAVLERLKDPAQAHAEAVAEVARIRDALGLAREEHRQARADHRRNLDRLVRAEYGGAVADTILRAIHGDERAAAYVRDFVERQAAVGDERAKLALDLHGDVETTLAELMLTTIGGDLFRAGVGDERAVADARQSSNDSLDAFIDYAELEHELNQAKDRADALIIAKRASEAAWAVSE